MLFALRKKVVMAFPTSTHSEVHKMLMEPDLIPKIVLMNELSTPVDHAINFFMRRTKLVNRLDLTDNIADSTSSDESDSDSDTDTDDQNVQIPAVLPNADVEPRDHPILAVVLGGGELSETQEAGSDDPGPSAFGPERVQIGIDEVETTSLPETAKQFLNVISGSMARGVIVEHFKTLLRLLRHGLDCSCFGAGVVDPSSDIDFDMLLTCTLECISDIWLREVFIYQCLPWVMFSLTLGSFEDRWPKMLATYRRCTGCVDVELSLAIFAAMPWENPSDDQRATIRDTVLQGLTDLAERTHLSSDTVECFHASSNLQLLRHKCGMQKQQLHPVHHTMASYCLNFVAEQQRRARSIRSRVLPPRMVSSNIVKSFSRKGCNQYSGAGARKPKKELQRSLKPRRVSGWNMFTREKCRISSLSQASGLSTHGSLVLSGRTYHKRNVRSSRSRLRRKTILVLSCWRHLCPLQGSRMTR